MMDRSGLLVCSVDNERSQWRFTVDACSLRLALTLPLSESLDSGHRAAFFSEADPWHSEPALSELCAWVRGSPAEMAPSPVGLHPKVSCHMRLAVHETAHAGRGLVISDDCPRGALLLDEEAHAAVLYGEHRASHCHACLRPLPSAAVSCGGAGCDEVYCGEECRSRAAWWHSTECGTRYAASVPPTALLAARALLRQPARGGAAACSGPGGTSPTAMPSGRESAPPQGDGVELQSHAESLGAARLSQLRLHAHVGYRVLRGAFEALGRSESQLLHLLCCCLSNVFLVTAVSDASIASSMQGAAPPVGRAVGGGPQLVRKLRLGEALYSCGCLLNHSCEPNTSLRFDGARLQARSLRTTYYLLLTTLLTCTPAGPSLNGPPAR